MNDDTDNNNEDDNNNSIERLAVVNWFQFNSITFTKQYYTFDSCIVIIITVVLSFCRADWNITPTKTLALILSENVADYRNTSSICIEFL